VFIVRGGDFAPRSRSGRPGGSDFQNRTFLFAIIAGAAVFSGGFCAPGPTPSGQAWLISSCSLSARSGWAAIYGAGDRQRTWCDRRPAPTRPDCLARDRRSYAGALIFFFPQLFLVSGAAVFGRLPSSYWFRGGFSILCLATDPPVICAWDFVFGHGLDRVSFSSTAFRKKERFGAR